MKPRRWRSLLYVLAALQLLMSAPMASAFSAREHASATPCADEISAAAAHEEGCPCCPEGTDNADCLSACTAAFAAVASLRIRVVATPQRVIEMPPHLPLVHAADPPLDPPPIR